MIRQIERGVFYYMRDRMFIDSMVYPDVHEQVDVIMLPKSGLGHLVDFVLYGMDWSTVRASEFIKTGWRDGNNRIFITSSEI